jgi:Skp family chaperone for outer membrane proteins
MKRLKWMIIICLLIFSVSLSAQVYEHAADYIGFINKKREEITTKYMVYLSSMSHGKSARKVDKRRVDVVNSISDTKFEIMGMPPWKGDKSFRDSTVGYLKILNTVFNEDYHKIVNMEEIAEQSYDAMEAYMLAQDKAYEKLNEAADKQQEALKQFAAKNNVNLLEGSSEVGSKAKTANMVMAHCNEL